MIRYKKIGYVALNVTEPERSAAFHEEFVGLDIVERDDAGTVYLSSTRDHHSLALYRGATPGLKRIAFELEGPAQLDMAAKRLQSLGIRYTELTDEDRARVKVGPGLRFRDVNGVALEFYVGMFQRPGVMRTAPTRPTHLSHIVMRMPNFAETCAFYTIALNFVTSDIRHQPDAKPYFAFLRCFPSPLHHSLALQQGKSLAFFHVAYHVPLDDLMRGRNRLQAAGHVVAPAPGRHVASGSIFQYFADPDGLTFEFTNGMEEFPETGAREPRMLDSAYATTDMWEGPPPSNLPSVGNIELG